MYWVGQQARACWRTTLRIDLLILISENIMCGPFPERPKS